MKLLHGNRKGDLVAPVAGPAHARAGDARIAAGGGIETLETRRMLCADPHVARHEPLGRHALDAATVAAPLAVPSYRINVGGGAYTDAAGRAWSADADFTGGAASTAAYDVGGTNDDPLYSTRRFGAFGYSVPVPDGSYGLSLHFADPLYTAAGQRRFDVSAEGKQVLNDFDVAGSGGGQAAIVRGFGVTVRGGRLDLAFARVLEEPILSGIELVPVNGADEAPAPPSGLDAFGLQGGAIRLTWADNSATESAFRVERSIGGGSFGPVGAVGAGTTSFVDTGLAAGTIYTYRVRAVGPTTASDPSSTDSAGPGSTPGGGDEDFTQLTWATRAAGPIARSEALGGAMNGKLYVLGGFNGGNGPVVRSDAYDPAANAWAPLADLPTRLTHAGVAIDAAGNDIYLAGGYVGTGPGYAQQFGTKQVWKYDADANSYSPLPDLPAARAGGGLVLLGRGLHYFSGNNSSRQDVGDHYVLDLEAGGGATWSTAAALPNPRSHMGYANFGGKIYAIAGQTGNDGALTTRGSVHVWDPASPGAWTELAPIPQAVSHISSSTFVMGDRIIVAGGERSHDEAVNNVWAFDPAANDWTALTALPSPRYSGLAGVIGGNVYFTGGSATTTTYRGVPVAPAAGPAVRSLPIAAARGPAIQRDSASRPPSPVAAGDDLAGARRLSRIPGVTSLLAEGGPLPLRRRGRQS